VDAAAKLEGQIIFERSELDSLKQIYGDENIRIRSARARVAELQRQLDTISGTSTPLPDKPATPQNALLDRSAADYPSLRQIPRLAVPYADIYRRVRVQETLFEMLTQQFELARIQEAKDVPVVRVIDLPGIPEKKSFPPRTLFCLLLTAFSMICASTSILVRHRWQIMDSSDERKILGIQVASSIRGQALRARSVFWRSSNA
jgi:uncharacterized protein involved in exopolysaccharide biosynthesis